MTHGNSSSRVPTLCSLPFLSLPPSSIPTPIFSAQMARSLHFQGKYDLSSSTHEDSITCVAFSIKGDYVASGGLGQTLQIFSMDDGKLHYSIVTTSPIKSLIWLPGAEQTLLCGCHSGIILNITIRPGVCGHIIFNPYVLKSHISHEGYHEYQLLSSKTSFH